MYSVLEFNNECTELDVKMARIHGIFAKDGKDSFTQTSYGGKKMSVTYLCQNYKYSAGSESGADGLSGMEEGDILYRKDENKYYKYTNGSWSEYKDMIYGNWETEYPTGTDNGYLHIKF